LHILISIISSHPRVPVLYSGWDIKFYPKFPLLFSMALSLLSKPFPIYH